MKITRFGAFVLLLTSGLTAGCAPQNEGNDINQASKAMTQDEARSAVSRTHGSTIGVCTAIGYDSDSDGINDVFAYVIGQDADADLLAVIPTDMTDIYSTGQYGCVFDDLNGFVEIMTDADIGADCSDTDSAIGMAGTATYPDLDGDLYGDASGTATMVCNLATGDITDNTDCDDGDAAINPAATEMCDGVDNDCDSLTDDADASVSDQDEWFADSDGDTFGDDASSMMACDQPSGSVADNTDCDDGDSTSYPGATEVADDGIDQDCDGSDQVSSDPDADGDGFVASADCDDGDAAINPDATEVSLDGVDNDCDGAANSSDTVEVCGAPSTELAGFSWQLWLRDATVYPDGNDDTGWDFPGYAQGVGTLCADFTLIDGNTIALNGPFDIDGDGTYGEEAVDGDGVWAYMDVVNLSGVTGDGYTISLTNTPWGAGSNGESVIDLL